MSAIGWPPTLPTSQTSSEEQEVTRVRLLAAVKDLQRR